MRKDILFVLLFFLTGCVSRPASVDSPTAKPLPSQTSTTTIIPSPTKTVTPFPSLTMTALPTWTLLPTLSSKDGVETFYEWLKGSDSCNFPCWAGITPGETSWEEAKQLIESMRGFAKLGTFLDENCTFGNCNEVRWSLNSPLLGVGYVYSQLPENKIHLIQMEIGDIYLVKDRKSVV